MRKIAYLGESLEWADGKNKIILDSGQRIYSLPFFFLAGRKRLEFSANPVAESFYLDISANILIIHIVLINPFY